MIRPKAAVIHGVARLAAKNPPLRRLLMAMLNLVPHVKQRLKRASVQAAVSRHAVVASGHPDEETLLSPRARRALRDLRDERRRREERPESQSQRI